MSDFDRRANRNTLWASVFVEALFGAGVETACLSPGSRSTPLALALAAHPKMRVYTHIDERSGAFFALGHAKCTGLPVALLCTSGSAAANFHPALIEASHGCVPLIVCTADRPPELRDSGAGQTIDQLKLYGSAVRWFFEVGTPEMSEPALRHLKSLAGRAVAEATGARPGPVHLNFPFRKPLEPTPVPGDVPEGIGEQAGGPAGEEPAPFARSVAPVQSAQPEVLRRLARMVARAPRGLIVCGPPDGSAAPAPNGAGGWPEAVALLARRTGYPLFAEPPSQVRSGPHDTTRVVAMGEAILRSEAFRAKLSPQLVIRFGAMPTAKHLEVLLDEHPDCPIVLVNRGGAWLEPTHHPTELVRADPAAFCRTLAEALPPGDPPADAVWGEPFREAQRLAAAAVAEMFDEQNPAGLGGEWFEGRVFAELAALLPDGALQYTASSMPVRDLDAFTPVSASAVRHLVNRGANGIDGTLSSALGAAAALGEAGGGPAVLVTGDLAFLHDTNGLLAARRYDLALTVILINNRGGGIFEMLPIADYGTAYTEHFATPHEVDFQALAAAHGIPVHRPADWAHFRTLVARSLAEPGTQVIELVTDRAANKLLHQRVWDAVATRLAAAFPPARAVG